MTALIRDLTGIRFTTRGVIVLSIIWTTAVITFTAVTSDICWTGAGYGSCEQLRTPHEPRGNP